MTAAAFAKATGSYVPGPALIIFGYWASAFSALGLSNPLWERNMSRAGLIVGVLKRRQRPRRSDPWGLPHFVSGFVSLGLAVFNAVFFVFFPICVSS